MPRHTLASLGQGKRFARKGSAPSAIAAVAVLILLASFPQSHAGTPTRGSRSTGGPALSPRPASMGLAAAPGVEALQPSPSPAYDEQLGTTFTQDFSSLAYNVTALGQADADGYGPGYLLNGLTPNGYWYQVGVSYHWPDSDGSYYQGFGFSYQVYGPTGVSLYPTKGAGLDAFSGTVNSGDIVLLSLTFTGSSVVMQAQDENTSAVAVTTYSSEGASSFAGDTFSSVNSNGFFTGLMTEWYHGAPYYGNEGEVAYTNSGVALSSAWMWIDEFESSNTAPTLFNNQTRSPVTIANEQQVYPFAADGATMYISAHEFVTGASAKASRLTLTPATPAEVGASLLSLSANYTLAGQLQTTSVTPGVNVLEADPGTMVTVAIAPTGSSEAAVFSNSASGNEVTFPAGTNATYVYYLLAQQTVWYQVAGGGQILPASSAPELIYEGPPPVASGTLAPVTTTLALGTTPTVIFALVGSAISIDGTVPGAAGERWATDAQNQTILAPNSLPDPIEFYHQYDVSVSYSVVGGGTPPQVPEFDSTAFGGPVVVSLMHDATTSWLDAGSSYSFTQFLNGSTPTERWMQSAGVMASQADFGTPFPSVSAPNQNITGEYVHQYYADLSANEASGGSITGDYSSTQGAGSISSGQGWLDAGLNLTLKPTPNRDWQFEDWTGSGAGAYNGTRPTINATVTGPLNESATFYPQLVISADGGTNVAYSYGSNSGTVQAGTTRTLYVPPSTNVTLRATPSLFFYSFASWQGTGLSKATKPSLGLVVDSPSAVTGASTYDYPVVLGLAIAAALVIILAVSLMARSRRQREDAYGFRTSYP
ncbi:MAG: hypothetical protein OK442_01940 [Thaumarchaeota archaeon]|nr:hypothetical protein [Nitrososphaerota archaeon]